MPRWRIWSWNSMRPTCSSLCTLAIAVLKRRAAPVPRAWGASRRTIIRKQLLTFSINKPRLKRRLPRPRRAGTSRQDVGELGEKRLVGHVEPQRRHRDVVLAERRQIGSERRGRALAPIIGDPVVRVATAVVARLDLQQGRLSAVALGTARNAPHLCGRAIREIYVDQDAARNSGREHLADHLGAEPHGRFPVWLLARRRAER